MQNIYFMKHSPRSGRESNEKVMLFQCKTFFLHDSQHLEPHDRWQKWKHRFFIVKDQQIFKKRISFDEFVDISKKKTSCWSKFLASN